LTENVGLFAQATSGVEEPFFRVIDAPPGLKSRMAEFQFYVLVLSISKPSQVSA
jgi:hypothetical protein